MKQIQPSKLIEICVSILYANFQPEHLIYSFDSLTGNSRDQSLNHDVKFIPQAVYTY